MLRRHPAWSFLVPLISLSFFFRLIYMLRTELWWDEIALWHEALGGTSCNFDSPITSWVHAISMGVLRDTSPFSFRFPSALFGSLAIVPAYDIARQLMPQTARLATCLYALSPLVIYTSQQGRPYGMLQFFTLLTIAYLLRWLTEPNTRKLLIATMALMATIATHVIGMQLGVAILLWLPLHWWSAAKPQPTLKYKLQACTALLIASICGFFMSGFTVMQTTAIEGIYQPSGWHFLGTVLYNLNPLAHFSPKAIPTKYLLLILIYTSIALFGVFQLMRERQQRCLRTILILLTVPLCITYVTLGEKGGWPLWTRYISFLPLFYLMLLANGLNELLPQRFSTNVIHSPWTSFALAALLCYPGLSRTLTAPGHPDVQIVREKAAAVAKHADKLQGVIISQEMSNYCNEAERHLVIWHWVSQSELPIYVVDRGELRHGITQPSRFGLGSIPLIGAPISSPLLAGPYAILGGFGPEICQQLENLPYVHLQDAKLWSDNLPVCLHAAK